MGANRMGLAVQQSFGATGSDYQSEYSTGIIAGTNYQVPRGWWIMAGVANLSLQYSPDGGTTLRSVYPASTGGTFYSDGFNFYLVSASGTVTPYLARLA